uniref:Zf-trcl domain-containing protein n=1 Tax=Globodera pallida TaxID=36090 RepID=A0A183BYL4_GLOPA
MCLNDRLLVKLEPPEAIQKHNKPVQCEKCARTWTRRYWVKIGFPRAAPRTLADYIKEHMWTMDMNERHPNDPDRRLDAPTFGRDGGGAGAQRKEYEK